MNDEELFRIGELLTGIKASLKHGQWLPWVKENLPFDRMTAFRYMRLWEHGDEIKCYLKTTFELHRRLQTSVLRNARRSGGIGDSRPVMIECAGPELGTVLRWPSLWIIRNQFGRRNITLAGRCELATLLEEALKPKAKENQKRKPNSVSPILAEQKIDVREQAAKEAGISHGSLSGWTYLKKHATPEELTDLLTNPNTNLHAVFKMVKDWPTKP